jgi:hypothetical protein
MRTMLDTPLVRGERGVPAEVEALRLDMTEQGQASDNPPVTCPVLIYIGTLASLHALHVFTWPFSVAAHPPSVSRFTQTNLGKVHPYIYYGIAADSLMKKNATFYAERLREHDPRHTRR